MKNKLYFFASLSVLALAFWSCDNDKDIVVPHTTVIEDNGKPFVATTESYSPETKTSLNNGNVLWKTGDQVSIFAASTINDQYQVTDGSNGKTSASLNKINPAGFVAGVELDDNVAYYPYSASNEVVKNGSDYDLTVSLPSTQNYAENSFGNGAFPMVAVTKGSGDMNLTFKNVIGGLKLQLTGTDVISRIEVSGNNDEILCGDATVTASNTTTPSIVLSDDTKTVVTLDCGSGVQLNSETPTIFIIALPPMIMTGGFTIDIYNTENGTQQIKSTRSQTITRSALLAMPTVAVSLESPAPNTSTIDGYVDGYGYVDLGLSVLWAAHNIGANTPEKVGSRFVWAYTSPSGDIEHYNYKYSYYDDSYEDYFLTKYCHRDDEGSVDNLMVLLPEDDAAYINWGYHWRMPRTQEFNELISLCTWSELPTGYNVTGPNGNSIFLPTKELRDGGYYYSPTLRGDYWSSSLKEDGFHTASSWNAVVLDGNSLTYNSRVFAYYIRPVCVSTNDVTSVTLNNSSLTLTIRETSNLQATVLPSNVTNKTVSWTSSDPSIATVSRNGVVTAKAVGTATISAECCGVSATCSVTVKEVDVISINLSKTVLQLITSSTSTAEIEAIFSPSNAYVNTITWTSSAPSIATVTRLTWDKVIVTAISVGTTTITVECGGKSASCDVTVINPEFVDLGLSVKWATFNVGATAPHEYGDYFAWGETEPYYEAGYAQESPQVHWKDGKSSGYAWSNYKYCNGSETTLTKYCNISSNGYNGFTDTKTTLVLQEDDVARVVWGGNWRMPTYNQLIELRDNCTWTWTTRNGVNGYLVSSKKSGYTDRSIFLPAAGHCDGTGLDNVGSWGNYWSRSLHTDYPSFAWELDFRSSNQLIMSTGDRYCGLSVRPVCP